MGKLYPAFNVSDYTVRHYSPMSARDPVCFRGRVGKRPKLFVFTSHLPDVNCPACKFMIRPRNQRWTYRCLIKSLDRYAQSITINTTIKGDLKYD